MSFRQRLTLSVHRQRQATWAMEVILVGILLVGIERGSPTIIVNAGVALGIAQLPSILERDVGVPMNPALTLWLTAAAFFHALGVVGVPWGGTRNLYGSIPWWDHFTHALSASVVAGAGYATIRGLDAHSPRTDLPSRAVFVFILVFVMAFGVAWEVLEFVLGEFARFVGNRSLLTQYGLEDTMLDLVFDLLGAVLVAIWGTAYLSDFVAHIEAVVTARTP